MDNGNMERENIVELLDENDNVVRFEHIMTVEYEGDKYALLSPLEELEDEEEGDVVILRIDESENEDTYVGIEDEAILEAVFAKYLEIAESEEDE